ncbi:hypothetical protein BOTBODRAFT_274880 [Botryobasidium botryosum FD-172 SS1]|uniref:Uncharacterized protein n=1 Tax=Botryobasidium botryosum (strain FD-172 SS1) TaxID=930990 RepID=A0A067MWI5_BOTB1|nr:hypothetical protein BOTBODRAFT_274880 [Botryobasidium botryosum FD-172 SS1]
MTAKNKSSKATSYRRWYKPSWKKELLFGKLIPELNRKETRTAIDWCHCIRGYLGRGPCSGASKRIHYFQLAIGLEFRRMSK